MTPEELIENSSVEVELDGESVYTSLAQVDAGWCVWWPTTVSGRDAPWEPSQLVLLSCLDIERMSLCDDGKTYRSRLCFKTVDGIRQRK
jgi:hypothetical protein